MKAEADRKFSEATAAKTAKGTEELLRKLGTKKIGSLNQTPADYKEALEELEKIGVGSPRQAFESAERFADRVQTIPPKE